MNIFNRWNELLIKWDDLSLTREIEGKSHPLRVMKYRRILFEEGVGEVSYERVLSDFASGDEDFKKCLEYMFLEPITNELMDYTMEIVDTENLKDLYALHIDNKNERLLKTLLKLKAEVVQDFIHKIS